MKSVLGYLGWGAAWLVASFLDLLILTALVYAVGHWLFHVW